MVTSLMIIIGVEDVAIAFLKSISFRGQGERDQGEPPPHGRNRLPYLLNIPCSKGMDVGQHEFAKFSLSHNWFNPSYQHSLWDVAQLNSTFGECHRFWVKAWD
ncbi:hypothetical protein VNO77_03794 [Canavalia gladiata]|uniref:Uncharacterized protein n=1 Tax=Canavalia gladiata TaxID=3824 RepID=A0AAN9R763_CANGL